MALYQLSYVRVGGQYTEARRPVGRIVSGMVDVAARPHTAPEPGLERRDEIALCAFATWMIIGLYLDGWAHIHNKPETFFTPWHAVLYSGFGAAVAYFASVGLRRGNALSLPPDRLAIIGLIAFFLGGAGDLVWHSIFGVEADLEALLSPTHLLLLAGGVAMVSAPLRSAWLRRGPRSPGVREFAPAFVSVLLATLVVSFFLMYVSAFDLGSLESDGLWTAYLQQAHGVASILITNAVLLAPAFILLRRWRLPAGALTVLFTAVALGMVAINGFRYPLLVFPAIAGGLAADAVSRGPSRRRSSRLVGAVAPAVLWGAWVLAVRSTGGIEWPPELVAGSVFLASLSGLMLSVLVFPPTEPAGLDG